MMTAIQEIRTTGTVTRPDSGMGGVTTTKPTRPTEELTERPSRVCRLFGAALEQVRSVRARILAWVVLLTALGLAGSAAAAYVLETERIEARIDRSLAQEVEEFEEFQRTGIDPRTGRAFTTIDRLFEVALQRNVPDEHQTLVGYLPGKAPIVPAGEAVPLHSDPGFRASATASAQPTYGDFETPYGLIRFATKPVVHGARQGTFVVAYFTARERAEFIDSVRTYAAVAVVALVVVTLVAWFTAGRLLQPIRTVRRAAHRISESDLSDRIAVSGNDDVTQLARTFNAMLDRIEGAFSTQRQFLDDAGHELRTPITILRGHLELLDAADPQDVRQTRALVLDELDRMSRMVEDLVLLAKARRPDFLRVRSVDVGSLTDAVLEKAHALGPRQWLLDGRARIVILADPQRLTQALVQLADNAVKYTAPGDVIAIGSAVDGDAVRLWVRDTGPGIAAEDHDRIFDRFQRGRGEQRVDGSGLGLAIVAAIAQAHRGDVWVDSEEGDGAAFVLEIPAGLAAPPPGDQDEGNMVVLRG